MSVKPVVWTTPGFAALGLIRLGGFFASVVYYRMDADRIMRRYGRAFSTFIFVVATAWACVPAPTGGLVQEATSTSTLSAPTSTPAPSPTPARSRATIRGDPQDLVIQLEDLPAGFQQITGEYDGPNSYTTVYFSPESFVAEPHSEAGLLAVVTNLGIYENVAAAQEQFAAQEGLDRESIASSMLGTSGEATLIDVQPYDIQLEGTDDVRVLRVHYEIGSTALIDYRYGLIVGNAVANLFVTARALGDGGDSPTLRDQARAIVEQQVARLNQTGR